MSSKYKQQFADPLGGLVYDPTGMRYLSAGAGAPTSSVGGYAVGGLYIDLTNAALYQNTGTTASATWTGVSGAATSLSLADNATLATTTGNGARIAGNNAQKLGFWGATPVVRLATNGEANGYLGNAATNTNAGTFTANGNSGSSAYTLGDVVKAMKQYGLLAT